MTATTKVGTASMAYVDVVAMRSKSRLGRSAATRARGMATRKASICDTMISSMSMGKASPMALDTVWWVRKEMPRLPWRTFLIQIQYCTGTDLLRPS